MLKLLWACILMFSLISIGMAENVPGNSTPGSADLSHPLEQWADLANQGDRNAQYNLAYSYANGFGLPKDLEKALLWYQKAAIQGDARAAFNMGVIYEKDGDLRDYQLALRWYNVAANRCSIKAMVNIGSMYNQGLGVLQNKKKALRWNKRAAEFGDKYAQYKVGLRYWDQEIIPRDLEHAYMWLSLAGQQDHHQGYALREILVKNMTSSQISKSEKLAKEWQPRACSSH